MKYKVTSRSCTIVQESTHYNNDHRPPKSFIQSSKEYYNSVTIASINSQALASFSNRIVLLYIAKGERWGDEEGVPLGEEGHTTWRRKRAKW